MVREIVQVSTNQGRPALPNDVAVTEQRPAGRPAAPIAPPGSAAILERLTRLHPRLIDLSLGRIERLLARLGNPERRLPPVVHVAGTNGKGSVVAFIRAIVEAAGYSVHAYTSPHLVRFNERVRLAGGDISDEALAALLEECEKANAGEVITFFEITTAAALVAFARAPADVVLLETGLGGRLDATNVVPRPALTVLTPVSIDHQHFLGETLAEIAGEKAGIVKPGVVCVSALQEDAVADVIAGRAAALGAPLVSGGRDWSVRGDGGGLVFEGGGRTRNLPPPALVGAHQTENAGLAVACVDHLPGFTVPDAALAQGMAAVEWPGRLQRLMRGPLVETLPAGWEVWVDGGHNGAAAAALAAHARHWRSRPLHLIFGILGSKDPVAFLEPLAAAAGYLKTVAIPGTVGSLDAGEAAAAGRSLGMDADAADTVAEALGAIVARETLPARVLICGSLYLVGTVLAENG